MIRFNAVKIKKKSVIITDFVLFAGVNYFTGAVAAVSTFAVSTFAVSTFTAVESPVAGASAFLEEQDTHATVATTANNKTNFFIFFYL
jgi:hypothetical protein